MEPRCGACQPFVDETERLFQATLQRYHFRFAQCLAEREGRECQAMYESLYASILFLQGDGSAACLIGAPGTPFPPFVLLHGIGDYGWYHVIPLAEVEAGRRLVSRCLMRAFIAGRVPYYAWQAQFLDERAERLFALVAQADPHDLAEAVARHVKKSPRW